jgi:hypothetical protein
VLDVLDRRLPRMNLNNADLDQTKQAGEIVDP